MSGRRDHEIVFTYRDILLVFINKEGLTAGTNAERFRTRRCAGRRNRGYHVAVIVTVCGKGDVGKAVAEIFAVFVVIALTDGTISIR